MQPMRILDVKFQPYTRTLRLRTLAPMALVFLASILLGSFAPGSLALAQELPDRPPAEELLPETTVLLVKIENFSETAEKFQNSMGAKLLEDENVAPLFKQLWEHAEDQYQTLAEEKVGLSLGELQSLPSGEIVFALVAPRREDLGFVAIMDLDEENEAVDKAFARATEVLTENSTIEDEENDYNLQLQRTVLGGNTVFYCRHQSTLIVASNRQVLEEMFIRWAGGENENVRPLSKNRKYVTISNRCRTSDELKPDFKFYLDPIGIYKAATRGDMGQQVVVAMLPALGLDGLLATGGNFYFQFEDYETIVHGHVLLASPREGIFNVLSFKPGEFRPSPWVPVNISSYSSTRWDVPQMFAEIREITNMIAGEGQFDGSIAKFNERAEIDLEADILDAVTGRVSLVRPILEGDYLNAVGNVVAVELNDPEAFQETWEGLMTRNDADKFWKPVDYKGVKYWSGAEATQERQQKRLQRRRKRAEKAGRDAPGGPPAFVRMPHPAVGIIGNEFIFSDDEEFFKTAIDTFDGDQPTLADDEVYQEQTELMTRLLKTDLPAATVYADSARELGMLLRAADSNAAQEALEKFASSNEESLRGLKTAFDDNPMPTYEDIQKYIPPSGGYMTTDDSGYHFLLFQQRREIEDE